MSLSVFCSVMSFLLCLPMLSWGFSWKTGRGCIRNSKVPMWIRNPLWKNLNSSVFVFICQSQLEFWKDLEREPCPGPLKEWLIWGGVTNKARTCIFAGHGRRQNKMWHLREQCYSLLPSRSPRVSHCQSMQQHSAVCPFSVLPSEANSHGGTGKERTALHYLFPTYRQRKPIRTGNPDTCLALTDSPQILLFCTSVSHSGPVLFPSISQRFSKDRWSGS